MHIIRLLKKDYLKTVSQFTNFNFKYYLRYKINVFGEYLYNVIYLISSLFIFSEVI